MPPFFSNFSFMSSRYASSFWPSCRQRVTLNWFIFYFCDFIFFSFLTFFILNYLFLSKGESTPQVKEAIMVEDSDEKLSMKQHQSHILYGGTTIMQHSVPQNGQSSSKKVFFFFFYLFIYLFISFINFFQGSTAVSASGGGGGCLAYVLRTGYETSQVSLFSFLTTKMHTGYFFLNILPPLLCSPFLSSISSNSLLLGQVNENNHVFCTQGDRKLP